jgi:trehalose-6-phosphate synthase
MHHIYTQVTLDIFFAQVAAAPQHALLLDYDGTLAPFHIDRDQAFPYRGVRELLTTLIAGGHTRVVIVSERAVADLTRLLGIDPPPELWGSHGWERQLPDGTYISPDLPAEKSLGLEAAYAVAQAHGLEHALERKPVSIAGHWRGLSPRAAAALREELIDLWQPIGQRYGFWLHYFDGGLELSAAQHDLFYLGFSNEVIWPLFHDLQTRANFDSRYYTAYEDVNQRFATVIARCARPDDLIWIHDYHLMNTALELRSLGVAMRMIFFLHIPFPAPDIFLKLPWRDPILAGLLQHDLVGFQSARDRDNFVACAQVLTEDLVIEEQEDLLILTTAGREVRLGVFPIGIDVVSFERAAATRAVTDLTRQIRTALGSQLRLLRCPERSYSWRAR